MRRAATCFITCAVVGAVICSPALAQWTPTKNVEVISAVAAGGAPDGTARIVQRIFSEKKLIPVSSVVVNRPGGQQTIAMNYLAQRPRDGHYIAVASTPLLSNQHHRRLHAALSRLHAVPALVLRVSRLGGPHRVADQGRPRLDRAHEEGPDLAVVRRRHVDRRHRAHRGRARPRGGRRRYHQDEGGGLQLLVGRHDRRARRPPRRGDFVRQRDLADGRNRQDAPAGGHVAGTSARRAGEGAVVEGARLRRRGPELAHADGPQGHAGGSARLLEEDRGGAGPDARVQGRPAQQRPVGDNGDRDGSVPRRAGAPVRPGAEGHRLSK